MRKTIFLSIFSLVAFFSLNGNAQNSVILKTHFDQSNVPKVPDYTQSEAWAALPTKEDRADKTPLKSNIIEKQTDAKADVFFLHPTTFTHEPKNQYLWNANVEDAELNEKTDNSTILNQA